MPATAQAAAARWIRDMSSVLAGATAADGSAIAPLVSAAAGHLVSFRTWHSLTHEEGLSEDEAVAIGVKFFLGVLGGLSVSDRPSDHR